MAAREALPVPAVVVVLVVARRALAAVVALAARRVLAVVVALVARRVLVVRRVLRVLQVQRAPQVQRVQRVPQVQQAPRALVPTQADSLRLVEVRARSSERARWLQSQRAWSFGCSSFGLPLD